MRYLLAVLVVFSLTGCAMFQHDPKPERNLGHVRRLVAKDTDPVDLAVNADALATAQGIADEADKREAYTGAIVTAVTGAAGATPWGSILEIVSTAGVGILGALHVRNRREIAKRAPKHDASSPGSPGSPNPPAPATKPA